MAKGRSRDPVQRAADAGADLYDVVTWEERTWLDVLSRRVYGGIVVTGRVLVIGLAVLILLGQVALTAAALARDPLVGIYILASVVPALVIVVYVWRSDVTMNQPLATVVVTFLLGLLFASFAAVINTSLQGLFATFGWLGLVLFFYLVVAPIEEAVKAFAVRIHAYRKDDFSAVVDGAVYGAVAGLGFATIENAIYITQQYSATAAVGAGGALLAALQTAAVRSFAGPGHVIYSAFAGYYLGLAKFNPENRGPIVVKGLLIAAFIHGTYNSLVSHLEVGLQAISAVVAIPPALAFVGFVVLYDGIFLLALVRKLRRYGQYFQHTGARHLTEREGPETE